MIRNPGERENTVHGRMRQTGLGGDGYGWYAGTGRAVQGGAALAVAGGTRCWMVNCRRPVAGGS